MEYILTLKDEKKQPLYFGTWSLSRFCELNGNMSFSEMQILFSQGLSFKHVISLFLCGAEHYCRKHKQPFEFSDIDASDWIDEIGGLTSKEFANVMELVAKAVNPSYQGIEVQKGDEEKKISVGSNLEQTASEPV